ncbi:four-helix bundle copper-binding protein [Flindersiella endophytica]
MTDQLPDEQLWVGIQRVFECYCSCSETITYCLEQSGPQMAGHALRLLIDCAEICQVAAGLLLRRSSLHRLVSISCAEACERCAQCCEQIDDEVLRQCAELCRRCADACRELTWEHTACLPPVVAGGLT